MASKMQTFFGGAFVGAVGLWLFLYLVAGWSSAGTTSLRSAEAVTAALADVCATRFVANEGWKTELEKAETYLRDEVVSRHIKKVGSRDMDWRLARACVAAIKNGKAT